MASDYGVDADAVASYAQGMAFTTTTTPSATQVATWIDRAALRFDATVRAAGVTPSTLHADTTSEGYALGYDYVVHRVAAQAVAARNSRPTDLSRAYLERADQLLREVRTWAAALGDARGNADGTPGLVNWPVRDSSDTDATLDAAFFGGARGRL
jgi:hypothetical protein